MIVKPGHTTGGHEESKGALKGALEDLLGRIRPPKRAEPAEVVRHLHNLTKPRGSLGHLEELALRLALIHGDPPPPLGGGVVCVLAGDHGVARRGVSAFPSEVTAQMCVNIGSGGAAINAVAGAVGARIVVADLGVNATLPADAGVLDRKVRRGTRDLSEEAAMTETEVLQAILVGVRLVEEHVGAARLVGLGEMGIGNTTPATAMTAAFTGRRVREVLGPGTGVSQEGLATKERLIERALHRIEGVRDPLEILRQVGGLEIAGLVGVLLGAARAGRAVVTDGFIATAAALAAVRICPRVREYLFASHRSAEPGHDVLLRKLDLKPLLDLEMRLGEGTGAALSFPILEGAAAVLREMATFESAKVTRRRDDASSEGPR